MKEPGKQVFPADWEQWTANRKAAWSIAGLQSCSEVLDDLIEELYFGDKDIDDTAENLEVELTAAAGFCEIALAVCRASRRKGMKRYAGKSDSDFLRTILLSDQKDRERLLQIADRLDAVGRLERALGFARRQLNAHDRAEINHILGGGE